MNVRLDWKMIAYWASVRAQRQNASKKVREKLQQPPLPVGAR